ncbi:MAG: hypothetical protein K0S32_102 [Bacteroidetes bacterium]|nr:hypothetical protein [Bacteroidota bacterium]
MQKKIHIFITLCLIHSALLFSQKLNSDSLISVIKNSKCIEMERIGITAVKSYIYRAASVLWEQSSTEDLIKFCEDKNANVRCYAFLGLIIYRDERKIAEQIADRHKNDCSRVIKWGSCIQWGCTVSEFMEMKLREFYSGDTFYRRLN